MKRAFFIALALASSAHAQERASARLVYHAEGDATCPDEQAFRDIVVARLGYDPFHEGAELVVDASIAPRESSLLAHLVLARGENTPVGERELGAPVGQCWELASSLAIALTVALDPFAAPPAPARSTPPPEPQPDAPPPTVVSPPPLAEAPRKDLGLVLQASLGVGFGVTPGPSLAPAIAAGLRVSHFDVLVEGRVDLMPNQRRLDSDDIVEAAAFVAGPVGCGRFGYGFGCLGLEFGAFQGRAVDVEDARTQSSFFAAASARLGAFVPLGDVLFAALSAELRAPLVRTSLGIDGSTVWNAPPIAGGLRLTLGASFL